MPCQHLHEIQDLKLAISNSDVLKVLCPVCGKVEVCAYTSMPDDALDEQEVSRVTAQDAQATIADTGDSHKPTT